MASKIASLIVDVAADTAALRQGMDKATSTVEGFASKAKNALGMFGVSLGAAAVFGFGKEIVAAAGDIQDMSDRLGIGTTAVQRFTNAAEMGGGSMEDVGKAINKMNLNLAGGKDSTKEALAAAGLKFDEIRAMKPEDAFEAIATGVSSIADPMKRAEAATALLGKGAAALLPTLGAIKDTSEDGLISPENIAALDDLGDAFTGAMQKGKALGAWFVGGFVRDIQTGQGWVEKTYLKLTLGSEGAAEAMRLQQSMSAATAKATADAEKTKQEALAKSEAEYEKTTTATKKKEAADKAASQAAEAHAKSIKSLTDSLTGKDDFNKAKDTLEALNKAHITAANVTKLSDDQQKSLNKTMGEALDYARRMGETAPKAMYDLYYATLQVPPVTTLVASSIKSIGTEVDIVTPKLNTFSGTVITGLRGMGDIGTQVAVPTWAQIKTNIDAAIAPARTFDQNIKAMSASMVQLAQVSGESFGGVAKGIGIGLTSLDSFKTGIGGIKDGFKGLASGAGGMLSNFTSMVGGIGTVIGAAQMAYQVVKSLLNLGGPSEAELAGRAAVEAFHKELDSLLTVQQRAESGNEAWKIDVIAIRDAYLAAGKTVEEADRATKKLWESSKGGAEGAAKAIAEIKAVMDQVAKGVTVPVNYVTNGTPPGGHGGGEAPEGYASGGRNIRGGMALVGEQGPELVNLPGGSAVIPNNKIGGGVNITVNAQTNATPEQITSAVQTALRRQGIF